MTVKVTVPDFLKFFEPMTAMPLLAVVPDDVPVMMPLQVPVTPAPGTAAPFESTTRTDALTDLPALVVTVVSVTLATWIVSTGAAVTLTTLVAVAVAPELSLTVSLAVNVPALV